MNNQEKQQSILEAALATASSIADGEVAAAAQIMLNYQQQHQDPQQQAGGGEVGASSIDQHDYPYDQELTAQGASHAENFEHHHQHEHDVNQVFYSEDTNTAMQQQNIEPSVYDTAIEAAKESYNIPPYETAGTLTTDGGTAVTDALIGEYFNINTTDVKERQQSMVTDSEVQYHDHSHAHVDHALDTSADVNHPAPIQGFNHIQYQEQQVVQVQQPLHPVPQPQTLPTQHMISHGQPIHELGIPNLPPLANTNFADATTNSISTTTRDNIDAIRARKEMDALVQQQSEVNKALKYAEHEFQRAQELLEKAKANKVLVDERVNDAANTLTDGLLKEHSNWNTMYAKLVKFKEKEGHCDVARNPYRSSSKKAKRDKDSLVQNELQTELVALGTWVGQNRLELDRILLLIFCAITKTACLHYRAHARRPDDHPDRIEPYKVIALNRLGFDWEPRENYWMEMYEHLKRYLEQNGKMPPRLINNQKYPLGQWCDTQLENYRQFQKGSKKAYITQEKIDMLNNIG